MKPKKLSVSRPQKSEKEKRFLQTPSQKQVWNNIAEEWSKWKNNPDPKVIKFVSSSKGNLLDLGSGSGRNFSKTKATIYALDFSEEMLKYAGQKAKQLKIKIKTIPYDIKKFSSIGSEFLDAQDSEKHIKNLDITKRLPFEDNFFDNIICIATLHCIKGRSIREKVLKELYRISKPKVKLLIKVWNRKNKKFHDKEERMIKWQDKGERYYYFYTKEELEKELKKAKFKILEAESQKNGFELQEIVILGEKSSTYPTKF